MSLIFIAGYTKHGKDTLFSHLAGEKEDLNYHFLPPFDIPKGRCHRVAFADALKADISQQYKIDIPENKDAPLNVNLLRRSFNGFPSPSFRDLCIFHSRLKKEENKYYYCEKVFDQILGHLKRGENVFITDWRFPEELEYFQMKEEFQCFKLVTIRVFRPHYPIPDKAIMSEHSLDQVKVDHIAIADLSETLFETLAQYQTLFPL